MSMRVPTRNKKTGVPFDKNDTRISAMANETEMEEKFWKALRSDMTVMLGLTDVEDGHSRPMTAQLEEDEGGPI